METAMMGRNFKPPSCTAKRQTGLYQLVAALLLLPAAAATIAHADAAPHTQLPNRFEAFARGAMQGAAR